ncbi:MAG: ABC transporter permease [Dehalococcoidia bacterium]
MTATARDEVTGATGIPSDVPARRGGRALAGVVLPPLVAATLAVIAWDVWVRVAEVPTYIVPSPAAVAQALAETPGRFARAALHSLVAAGGGLAIATAFALALAVPIAHSRAVERVLYPPAVLLKVTPIVAVYPLLMIWFGFGLWPKMVVAALLTFFPMLVNAVTGLRSIDPQAHDVLRVLHASRWQVFWRLRVPSSLPYLFAALRVSVPLALIGAVVAEFLSGSVGMGQLILIANGQFDTASIFAAMFILAALGVSLTAVLSYLERRVLDWHESSRGT